MSVGNIQLKITELKTFPLADSEGNVYFFVKIYTDAGIDGIGEVGISLWGRAIGSAVEHLSELLIGEDPWSTERHWQKMFRGNFFPADKVYMCAISAIDIALWDIKGKSVGMPVYKLLGGPVRDKVVCYPHTQGKSLAELVENCKHAVDEGWKFVRWGQPETLGELEYQGSHGRLEPTTSMKMAVEQMSSVRDAVGADIGICFDVHTRLDTRNTIEMCRELEEFKPFFIEDPIRSENPKSYRKISANINLPIAAGEQWASKWRFREVIEEESIDYARIDLCIVGGLTEALKITHWAETHYIDLMPHNPLGPICTAATVHLAAAVPNFAWLEHRVSPTETLAPNFDLYPQQLQAEGSRIYVPDTPGLGVDFNEELAKEKPFEFWEAPHPRRLDGSRTNW